MTEQNLAFQASDPIKTHFDSFMQGRARLEKLVPYVVEKLENALKEKGIPAKVAGRVKNKHSLHGKLQKWAGDPKRASRLTNGTSVFDIVGDLAAVRVMTYMERDRDDVVALVQDLFAPAPGDKGFDLDPKDNNASHYRATHLQIALKPEDCSEKNKLDDLKGAHCELQVTSMLAHVWNEIEHDFFYKADKDAVSADEKQALDSLGMLTRTGDNIVSTLIEANSQRTTQHRWQSKRFSTVDELESFLGNTYAGLKLGKTDIEFSARVDTLFEVLATLGIDHPEELLFLATPKKVVEGYRLAREIKAYQLKYKRKKSIIDPDTCDAIVAGLLPEFIGQLPTSPGNKRLVAIANVYREMKGLPQP